MDNVLIKPNKICNRCRKPKKADCDMCKPIAFENINKSNYTLYNSSKWRKFSKRYKATHPLCIQCKNSGKTIPSAITDHIRPIDKGGSIWDYINLQPLCSSCHNKKTGASKKVN